MAVRQKLVEARKQVVVVECDGETTTGARFEYASADAIIAAAAPVLAAAGVTYYQTGVEIIGQERKAIESGNKTQILHWLLLDVAWVMTDGEDEIELHTLGEAIDYGDNASTKAQTDALKRLLTTNVTVVTAPRRHGGQSGGGARSSDGDTSVGAILELRKRKQLTDEGFGSMLTQVAGKDTKLVKDLNNAQRRQLIEMLKHVPEKQ